MAAKPKLSPEHWASTRATWEAEPRKPLAWLIDELRLPVGAEALRLRTKAEDWTKAGMFGKAGDNLASKTKLGKGSRQAMQTPANPHKPL